jgi:hypothetical protein
MAALHVLGDVINAELELGAADVVLAALLGAFGGLAAEDS